MIRKSVERFSLATNAERVCAEIMLNQRAKARRRFNPILCFNGLRRLQKFRNRRGMADPTHAIDPDSLAPYTARTGA